MIKEKYSEGAWSSGIVKTKDGRKWTYSVKHFEEPSKYGIKRGRISKLSIADENGNEVAHYERGWDLKPDRSSVEVFETVVEKYDPGLIKKSTPKAPRFGMKLPSMSWLSRH